MDASTLTLADFLSRDREVEEYEVLVEHEPCGRCLGPHRAWIDDEGAVRLTDTTPRSSTAILRRGGSDPVRGPLTTPGVRDYMRDYDVLYLRCYCACLPPGHVDKRRASKLGAMPVTFPTWKWGRSVSLPVVTI